MKQQPLTANTVTFYHERSLRKALLQLESALSALGDTDRTLADAGVPKAARVPLSEAQMDVFELQSWIAAELRRSTELAPIEIAADPATPPAEAATPTAPPPTVQHAMELLFGGTMHADVETEHGQIVTLRLIDQLGARLHASAARLTVVDGMKLTGRVIDRQSVPWLILMVCRKAVEQDATADLTLDVAEIRGDDQRTADRLDVATGLTLHVVSSTSLRDADEIRGQIVNLSRDGLAFTAAEPLATGDRLRFYARFLEGAIEGELRVASLRTIAGDRILGCWFTEVEPTTRDVIDRILDRTRGETTSLSYPDLRALFHDGSQEGAFSAHIPGSGAQA
jgi:hypothetical protein